MSEKVNRVAIESMPTVFRVDPTSGKAVPGRYLWTPLAGHDCEFAEDLVYTPSAEEFLRQPDLPQSSPNSTTAAVGRLIAPTHEELKDLLESENRKTLAVAPSLRSVCDQYYRGCVGGQSESDNCAHFLSNAFILAGYTELLNSPIITARCRCGRRRPIRAQDMLSWFQSKATQRRFTRIERNTGIWATYQETPGSRHVVLIDTDRWLHFGTGDYWEWPVQWNYKW